MIKLILLEGLPKYEGVNEAQALAYSLRLMTRAYGKTTQRSLGIKPHTATDKQDFTKWLGKDTDFLHISAHGGIKRHRSYLEITGGGARAFFSWPVGRFHDRQACDGS